MGEAHPFPYKVRTSFKLTQYIPTNYNYRSVTTMSRHEEEVDATDPLSLAAHASPVGIGHPRPPPHLDTGNLADFGHVRGAWTQARETRPKWLCFVSADTPVLKMGPRPPNSGILPCRQFPSPSPPIPPPSNNLSCLK